MTTDMALLELRGVKKAYGRVQALNGVSLAIAPGQVVALLGDNGAGKSTVIRTLNGLARPDEGAILWEGRPAPLSSPRDAADLGIATVYQDLAMVDSMSIYRNMFLGREYMVQRRIGPISLIDHGKARQEASAAIAQLGISIKSTGAPVEALSGGQRQSIAIARAVHFGGKLLVLDEPTSALSLRQTDQVLKTIRHTADRGIAVLFVSHNIHHVFQVSDRFVVLSHGETVGDFARDEADEATVSDMIVNGRAVER